MIQLWFRIRSFLYKHRSTLIAFCIFTFIAAVLTWPFVIHPFSTYLSPAAGDVPNSVTKFDAIKNEHLNPFIDGHIQTIAVPDGIKSNVGVDRVSLFSTLFLWLGTLLTTSLFTHGLFTFLGYVSSGFVMFLFVRRFTQSYRSALFAGILSISFPLFISLARAAPIYMYTCLYLLPIWAYLELARGYSKKRLLLALLSFLPGFFWTPYFTYHVGLITVFCIIAYVIYEYRRSRKIPLRTPALAFSLLAIAVIVYVVAGKSSQFAEVPQRGIQEIYEQSLHPLMIMTPGSFSWLGQGLYSWMVTHVSRIKGTNLYLGISVIALAVCSIVFACRKKTNTEETRLVVFFALLSGVVFTFALAPTITIFGLTIATPNYFIAHTVPALRAGQRLVGILMVCISILAAIAIKYIPRFLSLRHPTIIFIAVCLLVGADIAAIPPGLSTRSLRSPAIISLAQQKRGLVAEYLSGSLVGDPSQIACKNYLIHKMPIMNYCGLDIFAPPHTLQTIWRLAARPKEEQPQLLQHYGVQYVIIDANDSNTRQIYNNTSSGYKQILNDQRFTIYARTSA